MHGVQPAIPRTSSQLLRTQDPEAARKTVGWTPCRLEGCRRQQAATRPRTPGLRPTHPGPNKTRRKYYRKFRCIFITLSRRLGFNIGPISQSVSRIRNRLTKSATPAINNRNMHQPSYEQRKKKPMDPAQDFKDAIKGKFATILADPPWRFANRTGKVAREHKWLNRYDTLTPKQA